MIRKGAVWRTGSGADIANASSLVTGLKHYLQPGINHIFAKRRPTHNKGVIRSYVLFINSYFRPSARYHPFLWPKNGQLVFANTDISDLIKRKYHITQREFLRGISSHDKDISCGLTNARDG
jgi:hypothetical protein